MASSKTYGHTGFTGTCVWVDPESELIFIFLSNRIHPSIKNRQLFRKKTRTRIHNIVYEALGTYPEDKKFEKTMEEEKEKDSEFFHANASTNEELEMRN